MPSQQDPLWLALVAYEVGPADAALSFTQRLARENGWSEAHANRVVGEYKRFCYLAMRAGHPVTPSPAVDQAWHLHLTYTRDYWERFCGEVLGKPLHHGPTEGGTEGRAKHFEQYAQTLASYEIHFGEPSPPDIWPEANAMLHGGGKRWVETSKVVVLRRNLLAIIALLGLVLMIAAGIAIWGGLG